MAINTFRYHSSRSEKARINARLTKAWLAVLSVSMLTLIIVGMTSVLYGFAFGWALIGLAAIPAMIVEWKNGELQALLPRTKRESVDDVLAVDVLGLLPRSPSPYDIATILGQVYGGQFFAVRFGVGLGFLQEIASKDTNDTPMLWDEALNLQEQVGGQTITAGILVAALIKTHPKHDSLLAHLQLSLDDIVEGVMWQNHIHRIIDEYKKPVRTGGIARDWSFGWIPLLTRFGQNLSRSGGISRIELETHTDAVDQLIETLSVKGHANAALVGPSGVGKTEILQVLASTLLDGSADLPSGLRFRQVFVLDASALLSAAPGRGELETLVDTILGEAYSAKNIIVCLDNAELFLEDGIGSIDLSNILVPILEAGRLQMILTMDEQRFLKISQRNGQLANALNRIVVAPPSKAETMSIMQDHLMSIEYSRQVTYMYQSMLEAYRLSERYVHDLAMPGRALKLLEAAAGYDDNGLVTARSVQQAIEKTMNVKIAKADTDDERDTLLNMESLIHERMINQTRAVSVVSDALRRARAGVRNQNRPIGTFLFLGPTGVGKTELAKALASVYFGGEDHIIRLDMNEFVSSDDVERLLADGADDANSLTAQVMKQPFSVILLDEVEKAHPNVLTTLLQLLDEGIMRDVRNREVSFRDAIIIATSNAGADRIREHIERGIEIDKFESQFVDELIASNQFRPEFLNRFDEIVMFRPLNKKELLQVVDLILKDVNKTLELQKVSVNVAADAKAYLVDAGYDPRLGARPMRRIVQRAVENTVAKQMLSGDVEPGSIIEISLAQVESILGNKQQADRIANDATS